MTIVQTNPDGSPYVPPTPAQWSAIDAAKVRLAIKRAQPPRYLRCEDDCLPGQHTQECADLANAMSGDGYSEPHTYSDYLGGVWSGIDPSGCHGGPSMPISYVVLTPDGNLVEKVEHESDCACNAPTCPVRIEADAYEAVMGSL